MGIGGGRAAARVLVVAPRSVRRSVVSSRHILLGGHRRYFSFQPQNAAVWMNELRPRLLALSDSSLDAVPWATPIFEVVDALAQLEADRLSLCTQEASEADLEIKQLFTEEIAVVDMRISAEARRLEDALLSYNNRVQQGPGPRDAVLEVSPGVGGIEAGLFAGELWEMYMRLADARGWGFETESFLEQTGGGLQSATAIVSGPHFCEEGGPFDWLRCESGVHRVQRIPETDRKGRMQTSSATIVVMPVASEEDLVLPAADLRIDVTKKSSGPGGQSVNAAYQAIRITHLPTGMQVHCASSQSQHDNRNRALEMLRTRLLAQRAASRNDFEKVERKQQRGSGDRSEKIRTYNFQRDDVVDHRLGKEGHVYGAHAVLFGDDFQRILDAHRERFRLEDVQASLADLEDQLRPGRPKH